MPIPRVFNFHNARLSLAQSCIREFICKGFGGGLAAGLWAGHAVLDAASAVLQGIDRGAVADAASARAAYRAARGGPTPQAGSAVGVAGDCLGLMAEYTLAWVFDDTSAMQEIRSEFEDNTCDPGWLTALAQWLEYYWDGQPPQYVPPQGEAPAAIPLPEPGSGDGVLRVGVLGDWGTGEPEAFDVLDQLMQLNPDVIIHVGDIYYAGTPDECSDNFLEPIAAARAKYRRDVPVYTLAGNHDYYSGGAGYYGMLPLLNPTLHPERVQANSFFCLRNDHWQLQGMDTGYNDHDLLRVGCDTTTLQPVEVDWHTRRIGEAGSRKVILFSHHQLFSAFETIAGIYKNPSLEGNLATWQEAAKGNIVAWLWGHEHLLEVYAYPDGTPTGLPITGRCIGHGAFPVFIGDKVYTPNSSGAPVLKTSEPPYYVQTGDDNLVYDHGFALLELGPDSGKATYYQVSVSGDGSPPVSTPLLTESLPPEAGQ